MSLLVPIAGLLVAVVIFVPVSKRLGLGSVLGYLVAGIAVGPAGIGLLTDAESTRHVSEIGVAMLLFLIGLELKPARLWIMRRSVFLLGGLQVVVTTALVSVVPNVLGFSWATSFIIGFGLALSSTALVLPMLAERELLGQSAGRDSLGILLFQDLIVIPVMALVPFLAAGGMAAEAGTDWQGAAIGAACIVAIFVGGRYLVRPLFYAADFVKAREVFTAAALLTVIGTAAIAEFGGLSMSLGAFLAGVMLSDSEYRHEIQADIEPFEGLLLGLFFASIGMSLDFTLLANEPARIVGAVMLLLLIKGAVLYALARLNRHDHLGALRIAFAMAQGGEFALVLFGFAGTQGILPDSEMQRATMVVILSMAATPPLFMLLEKNVAPRLARKSAAVFDEIADEGVPVIICGFGRVGQIVGRILRVREIPFTALDDSAAQVEVIRRFGGKVYFGDPARPDLLKAAGADTAKVLVVAVSEMEHSIRIVDAARRHFPHLQIFARARNRRHAHLLMERQVTQHVRETLHSSLKLTERLLTHLGLPEQDIRATIDTFTEHDERSLVEQFAIYDDERQLIQNSKQAAEELDGLFRSDRK
jgi:glutathione-regulated potassium-efflux system protein KefB